MVISVLEFKISKTFSTEKINSCDEKDDNFSHADDSVIVPRRFPENNTAVSRSGSVNEISGLCKDTKTKKDKIRGWSAQKVGM